MGYLRDSVTKKPLEFFLFSITHKGGEKMTVTPNNDIRFLCRGQGIPLWKLAEVLGISEPTLYRKLRVPISGNEREKYLNAIATIQQQESTTEQAE